MMPTNEAERALVSIALKRYAAQNIDDREEAMALADRFSKPAELVRVVVDFSGSLFNGAYASVPVEIMAIDVNDGENPRAYVPGFEAAHHRPIWADIQDAVLDAELVSKAFAGYEPVTEDEFCGEKVTPEPVES